MSNPERSAGQHLSQNQVESLLKAMQSADPCDQNRSNQMHHEITIDEAVVAALKTLHEQVASQLSKSISTLLRCDAQTEVALDSLDGGVDQAHHHLFALLE